MAESFRIFCITFVIFIGILDISKPNVIENRGLKTYDYGEDFREKIRTRFFDMAMKIDRETLMRMLTEGKADEDIEKLVTKRGFFNHLWKLITSIFDCIFGWMFKPKPSPTVAPMPTPKPTPRPKPRPTKRPKTTTTTTTTTTTESKDDFTSTDVSATKPIGSSDNV